MSRWAGATLLLLFCLIHPAAARGEDAVPDCSENTTLLNAHQFCHYSGEQFHVMTHEHVDGVSYSIRPMCVETQDVVGSCINQQTCEAPPDTWKYMVFRSSPGNPHVPWGTVCLDIDTAEEFDVITPSKVLEEMQALEWPSAELVIQPPDGRTLVNLPTNFLTTTTQPTSQTITLLGQSVEIEASPVSYAWHFGDGASQEGADPGAAYPDLRITHTYVEADVTVTPSVDVTYQGRYRVEDGPWQDIPETLTVDGTPVSLQVLSATPHLVG
jgi:hypothetical protein